jgi:hypothetical protein
MVTVPVGVVVEGAVKIPAEVTEPAEAVHVTEGWPEAMNV